MSGKVSRLFAAEKQAQVALDNALKRQYGHDWEMNRYNANDHDETTTQARTAQSRALSAWHRAAMGN